jgi:hypothetical protein
MKTSIISYSILILIAVSACSPSLIIWEEAQYLVSGYDFTEYSQSGFLFTPEPYLGDYESFEPQTSALPARRSSQLSYSPIKRGSQS